jgi:RNA polymerase sigma-70 factor (ECF subfamily)
MRAELNPWLAKLTQLAPPSGLAVLAAAREGDSRAARQLVASLSVAAHGLAWRMLGNTADAQDVVQEGFIKLLNSPYRGESKLSTYFHTLISRLCLDRLRSSAHRPGHAGWEGDGDAAELSEDPGPNPEETLALHQSADQVHHAMMQLHPRQRLALNLWAHDDASVADIAHTLEIQTNAAHQLLHRAKIKLKHHLKALGHE